MSKKIVLRSLTLNNGENIAYRETGTGDRILLLVHGNMSSSKHWDLLMENLPDEYKIYAPDLRGFGNSSYHRPIRTLRDFSDDIRLFADDLGLREVTLAGWSMGGAVSMQFAADYADDVRGLILVESVGIRGHLFWGRDKRGFPIPDELLKTREDIAGDAGILKTVNAIAEKNKAFLKAVWNNLIYIHTPPDPERYAAYMEETLKQRNSVDVYHALTTFNISDESNGIVSGSGEVHKIEMPALIIQGENDPVIPEETGKEIAAGIGDNAELVILKNCGHSPTTDSLPELIRLFVEFMN